MHNMKVKHFLLVTSNFQDFFPCSKTKKKDTYFIWFHYTCFLHSKNCSSVTLSAKCFLCFKWRVMLWLRDALKLVLFKISSSSYDRKNQKGQKRDFNWYHTPCLFCQLPCYFFPQKCVAAISNNCYESKHKTFIPQHLQISHKCYCLFH